MTTANPEVKAALSGWPVDDITGLGRRLPEVDPARYFDEQARESYQLSLLKWPVLARLMKLVPLDEAVAPAMSVTTAPASNEPVQAAAAD
ncbi:hypothetical protein [Paraburkholderia caffeinilytica]|uniref:hypothetical protein n=1 Tax=Paraburkholderia caffeinilytica TaxID=1761016 RepID=UPI003DA0DF3B